MSQQDKTNCLTVIFSDAETLIDSCKLKMWVLHNYVSFFWLLPVEVSAADHPLPSQLIPCIFLSHQPSPCPLLPGCSIFNTLCQIYLLSPPLRMSKLSQPCLSFFVSKPHDLSYPSDVLLSNLPFWSPPLRKS